jgi:hypothetical protein
MSKQSNRSAAAHKAWATRRSNYPDGEARVLAEIELEKARLRDAARTPSSTKLFQLDEAIRLGWTFIINLDEDGNIQAGATLPLCNGDHVITPVMAVEDGGQRPCSERLLTAILHEIDGHYNSEKP